MRSRSLAFLSSLFVLSLTACGDPASGSATEGDTDGGTETETETGGEDYGTTPEEGLRGALGLDVGVRTQGVTLDNGDSADVYAPDVAAMGEAFVDRFPVVVVMQGGLTPKEQYRGYATALASYGFVVIVPEHLRAFPPMFPDPVQLTEANVIPVALDAVAALDGDATSVAWQIADTDRAVLTGHSQGGIISLLALAGQCIPGLCTEPFSLPSSVRAAALFGTNSVQDGVATPVETEGWPIALIQGELDGRAEPKDAELTYETLGTPRALISIDGVNHFGINDDNEIPGTNQDPIAQTLPQEESVAQVALWSALWIHASLEGPTQSVAEHWLFATEGAPEPGVTIQSDALDGV